MISMTSEAIHAFGCSYFGSLGLACLLDFLDLPGEGCYVDFMRALRLSVSVSSPPPPSPRQLQMPAGTAGPQPPERIPEDMPRRMSEDMPDRMQEHIATKIAR